MSSKFDELLSACAHRDLYRRNGFRMLGLAVPADPRSIARGFDELSINLELGAEPGAWAFAPRPAANQESLRAAARALQEPMRRLLDEFFWFWPLSYPVEGSDVGLAQLARGDTTAATLDWSQAAGQGHPVAWHNLAVYQHLLALEWERSDDCDPAVLNQVWREAADYWQRVREDEAFWRLVEARVRGLDEAQLPLSTVARLRERLPGILARIHAENAVHYVTKDVNAARLHVDLARSHLPPGQIAAVFEETVQPAVGRLEHHVAQARRQVAAHPADALTHLRPLVQSAAPDLALLAAFSTSTETAHLYGDQARLVADTALDGLVAYQRATGDDLSCLPLVFHLLDIASAPELRQRVEQAFSVMLENALVKARAAAGVPVPPDHVVIFDLITRSVVQALGELVLPPQARAATNARLAGWLEKLAEEAIEESPANTGWAFLALDYALGLPLDAANRAALNRIKDEWLTPPAPGALKPYQLVNGTGSLRIDEAGVALNGKLVPASELTGIRHQLTGYAAVSPRLIGWCSSDEGLALDEAWFNELGAMADAEAAARDILAALHGLLVPSMIARSVAAVRDGGMIAFGDVRIVAAGLSLAEGEAPIPFEQLRFAYLPERVSIAPVDNPLRRIELDPLLSWNVVLLPHFIAALTSRLP